MPSRLWFLNDDQTELLQLQNDRFGRNWRKMPPVDKPYPRFETMIAQFERELHMLSAFCVSNRIGKVVPTQCELSYVNFRRPRAFGQRRPQSELACFEISVLTSKASRLRSTSPTISS